MRPRIAGSSAAGWDVQLPVPPRAPPAESRVSKEAIPALLERRQWIAEFATALVQAVACTIPGPKLLSVVRQRGNPESPPTGGRRSLPLFRVDSRFFFENIFVQMLDAAHGEGVGAVVPIQRVDVRRIEVQVARVEIAGKPRRRRPHIAIRADGRQGSRVTGAVARSRVYNVQSLEWMSG